MRLFGFSTGGIRASLREALEALGESGVKAVEVSGCHVGMYGEEIAGCGGLLATFERVSVHVPRVTAENEAAMARAMAKVVARGHSVVLHPDEIAEFDLWLPLAENLLIENMDLQKTFGQTAAEIAAVLTRLPEARLCFDIGHAFQVDPSLAEARRFIEGFHRRMGQIHISSVDSRGLHSCLETGAVAAFRRVMPEVPGGVPFIHEGAPQSAAEIAREVALMTDLGA